jgi:hypothetical protein
MIGAEAASAAKAAGGGGKEDAGVVTAERGAETAAGEGGAAATTGLDEVGAAVNGTSPAATSISSSLSDATATAALRRDLRFEEEAEDTEKAADDVTI